MKCLIQRVKSAAAHVDGQVVGKIGQGLLIFLGIGRDDIDEKIDLMIEKIINLRVFENEDKHFDLSLLDIKGEALVVSQFTLYGNCDRGRRPDFFDSADPVRAEELYNKFIDKLKSKNIKTESGRFGACMQVQLVNDGPSTFLLEK